MSGVYYNEVDPFCVEWLRRLIVAGMIAPGDVDDRSIEDVTADDLRGYTQHHFFAGIGVWSYALRRAGWADDRPVWTGSCPCQPFSAAGKGGGFADERHLWPAWQWLVEQHRPDVVLGEQVASLDGLKWFDLVSADMEGSGYAVGASDQCVAGVGGPHIRQRLYFVGLQQPKGDRRIERRAEPERRSPESRCGAGGLSDSQGNGRSGRPDDCDEGRRQRASGSDCALGGFWRGSDWIWFRDGKYRPVEAGTFPLAAGAPARVGRLRAYGNALNAETARVFIEAVMACL